jgi:predicted O-methyltransferase YrrM
MTFDEVSNYLGKLRIFLGMGEWNEVCDHVYRERYERMLEWKPKTIFEIGVGAGFHANVMLAALPDAIYRGWDIGAGRRSGMYRIAQYSFDAFGYDAKVDFMDSQAQAFLPGKYDFIHVDGLHTYEGAMHDIDISVKSLNRGGHIIVDDYFNIEEVRNACHAARELYPGYSMFVLTDCGKRHNGGWVISSEQ